MIDKKEETCRLLLPQYQTLLQLSKAIVSHRQLSDLFHELAARLREILDFHYLSILLHDAERNVLQRHIIETTEPSMRQMPDEVAIEDSVSGWVWQNQQLHISNEVQLEEARFPILKTLSFLPVKSLCVLPLTTANRRLVVLFIASDKAGAYQRLDLEFAMHIAAQIAVALENTLNFQEARTHQQKLAQERDRSQLLLEINNMLVSNLNLRELLSAISLCLRRVVPHDFAGLSIYDETLNRLRVTALEFPDHENFFVDDDYIPITDPAQRAFNAGQAVLFEIRGDDSTIAKRFAALGMKTACLAPLISRGRRLGLLVVQSKLENAFHEDDARLLDQIAKQVAIAVENALAFNKIDELKNRLEEEKFYLEEEIRGEYNFEEIIGKSATLKKILYDVETVAATDSTVLIYGETGTGKELIARAIHNLSARRKRTMVKVNCAAIPGGLLESELFGHEKGAFTGAIERRIGRFELAHQGTIFLDEVGEIPLELQPKLLRVLQEQEFERLGSTRTLKVDARVVAATNCDLAEMVGEKKFRSDLYYRLNVFPITLPPLRERPEDIPLLARFFAQKFAARMNKKIEKIPSETMDSLIRYAWPGNVRELENFIERSVILSRGAMLEIPLAELKQTAKIVAEQSNGVTMEAVEREHVLRVLRETNWVIGGATGAAARLGLNRTTLNNRLRKLGITRPK